MKRWRILLVLGVAAFLLFAVVTLPASVVVSRLSAVGVNAAGVSGSIWNGRAQVLFAGGVRIGGVEWDLHVLPLFTGRVTADVKVTRVDGFAQARTTVRPSGQIALQDLTGSLPLSMMPPQFGGGWAGALNLRLASLVIEKGWPVAAQGEVQLMDLEGPAARPNKIGSYKATFPSRTSAPDALVGDVADLAGPIEVNATLQLKQADRSYVLEGSIAPRPDAPQEVARTLQYLGPADAQGRRQFSLAGTM